MNFQQAQSDVEQLLVIYKEVQQDYDKAVKLRNSLCTHSTTEGKETHSSAGYDYYSKSTYWDECVCCGAIINKREVHGNHFG